MAKAKKRFEIALDESNSFNSGSRIIKDTETGVMYFYHWSGYGGGLTPLLDADGKPIADKDS